MAVSIPIERHNGNNNVHEEPDALLLLKEIKEHISKHVREMYTPLNSTFI